ncbi:Kdo hydroxylase family protein [Aquirhabdus sp.]|uniref:Kdo hydroxylase family protein n=1 Tax=Aquirhabdus sp. TaxID=2824160 RepID=UPI00396C38AB
MSAVFELPITDWNQTFPQELTEQAVRSLEQGDVLILPQLHFALSEEENQFLSPSIIGKSKNVSFDPKTGKVQGSIVNEEAAVLLQKMMQRYATFARELMDHLFPEYQQDLIQSRTSYRPLEIAGRTTSWRKDDTRLHVDSFPATPVQDKRILRIFTNVNPHGKPRSWRLGESFEKVAQRFLPHIASPTWGVSGFLNSVGLTKSRRSDYDHYMLRMHDGMKADLDYQATVEHLAYDFPAGSTWIVFTDHVSHAAMAGQYVFEQTFYLPVHAMNDESQAPQRILERMKQQPLL